MDPAHLHLILNHIPIIGFPFLLAITAWAWLRSDTILQKACYAAAIALSLVTAGAFRTGEPAEHRAETVGASELLIEAHEEAAETAMIAVWASALIGALGWFSHPHPAVSRVTRSVFVLSLLLTSGLLGWVGFEGGKIRHSDDIRLSSPTAQHTDSRASDED